jgi:hypothetical protein
VGGGEGGGEDEEMGGEGGKRSKKNSKKQKKLDAAGPGASGDSDEFASRGEFKCAGGEAGGGGARNALAGGGGRGLPFDCVALSMVLNCEGDPLQR